MTTIRQGLLTETRKMRPGFDIPASARLPLRCGERRRVRGAYPVVCISLSLGRLNMSRFFLAVLGAVLAVGMGCSNKHDKSDAQMMKHDDAKMMSADACPHCPGVQKATADGKCPICGMQVGDMKKASSSDMRSDAST